MPDLAAGVGITLTKDASTDVLRIATDVVSGRLAFATYADLAADTMQAEGTVAEIPTTDAGTHTDPVVGGSVDNSGIFRWSASPAGWERIADTDAMSATGAAADAEASATAAAASATEASTTTRSILAISSTIDSPFENYPTQLTVIADENGNGRLQQANTGDAADPIYFGSADLENVGAGAELVESGGSIRTLVGTNGLTATVSGDTVEISGDAADTPTEFYLVGVLGQSNGTESGGTAADATDIPAGVGYHFLDGPARLADLTGTADGGWRASFMPAFAKAIWERTGRGVIFVNGCKGGTAMVAAADSGNGNWSSSGTLRGTMQTLLADAITYLDANGYCYQHCLDILIQGERDAQAIDAATIAAGDYEPALASFRTWQTGTLSGAKCPLVIVRTGTHFDGTSAADTAGFAAVRAGQMDFAATEPGVFMGFTSALNFPDLGLMYNGDGLGLHYNQDGKNKLGQLLGWSCAAIGAGVAAA